MNPGTAAELLINEGNKNRPTRTSRKDILTSFVVAIRRWRNQKETKKSGNDLVMR